MRGRGRQQPQCEEKTDGLLSEQIPAGLLQRERERDQVRVPQCVSGKCFITAELGNISANRVAALT